LLPPAATPRYELSSLLRDLATIAKNKIQPTDKTIAALALLTQPTAIQQRTFDLLGVPPATRLSGIQIVGK
jgi:hypothetical protein